MNKCYHLVCANIKVNNTCSLLPMRQDNGNCFVVIIPFVLMRLGTWVSNDLGAIEVVVVVSIIINMFKGNRFQIFFKQSIA